MLNTKDARRFSKTENLLILTTFLLCAAGAALLPIDWCPDEKGRRLLSDWMFLKSTLPTGHEEETMIELWGFSYALRPYLSSMIGALFMKATALLTGSNRALLLASRMGSVLSVTACCYFCLRLGHRLFEHRSSAILMALFVCYLPQVFFLGCYQNNDALSLCAVSMLLCFLVEGYDSRWDLKSCIGIGVSLSLGLLSYYYIYGWLLMSVVFCVGAVLSDRQIPHKGGLILRRALLIAGICLLLAGWFFARSAVLNDGDFLGLMSEARSRAWAQEHGWVLHEYTSPRDEGCSFWSFIRYKDGEWLRMTARSFVGVFGYMILYLPLPGYGLYDAFFALILLLFLAAVSLCRPDRRNSWLLGMMLASSAVTLTLHYYTSFARDYQPQGRYVISLVLLLGYLLAYGADRVELRVRAEGSEGETRTLRPAAPLAAVWLLLFAYAFFSTMIKMLAI